MSLVILNTCREVCHHKEAYVRRAVLFAAACILVALHPTFIASALLEGNVQISDGLEWIRTLALDVSESDTDRECYMVSKRNLQLQRSLESMLQRFFPVCLPRLLDYFFSYFSHDQIISIYVCFTIDGYDMHTTSCRDGSSNFPSLGVRKKFIEGISCSSIQSI